MNPFILRFRTPCEDILHDVALGVLTKTSVANESVSDPDRRFPGGWAMPGSNNQNDYGTQTRISGEQVDSSNESTDSLLPRIVLGTLTLTCVDAEAADSDPQSRSLKALPCS
jgi:hypothetical protein